MPKIKQLLLHLEKNKDNRAMMATLKRGLSPIQEALAWPYIGPWCGDLSNERKRAIYRTVMGCFALHPCNCSSGNLGVTAKAIVNGKEEGEGLNSFDRRFRRLLDCDTAQEACCFVPFFVKAAARKINGGVNYQQLFSDLWSWGPKTKEKWASGYWGTLYEKEPPMFLSKVEITREEAAQLKCQDSYAWHKIVWEAFPERSDVEREFLTRLDVNKEGFTLLILSDQQPTVTQWGMWSMKQVHKDFLEHDTYAFQLRANPTKRCGEKGKEATGRNKRVGIVDESELQEWLTRKGEQGGFKVLSVQIAEPKAISFQRQGVPGQHIATDFSGTLQVTDREKFRQTFQQGVGTAKAFGFGMLVLQPVS